MTAFDNQVIKLLKQKAATYRKKAERIEKLLSELNGLFDDSEVEISASMMHAKPPSLLESIIVFLKEWESSGKDGANTEQIYEGILNLGYVFENPSVKRQMQLIRSTVSRYRKKGIFARSIDGKMRLDKKYRSKIEDGGGDE